MGQLASGKSGQCLLQDFPIFRVRVSDPIFNFTQISISITMYKNISLNVDKFISLIMSVNEKDIHEFKVKEYPIDWIAKC